MSTKPPALHQPGDVVNGRYRIERQLGRGAMGEVYLAIDQARGDQRVAMKYLLTATSPSAINRFKAEFTTLAHLSHPHITPVYDLARDDACGVHFFTTEYVMGNTFDVAAVELPVPATVALFVQVLRALQYLHGHGRLHLDIKAANVMVQVAAGATPHAKLIDFGLAATGWFGKRMGTPSYMAPEIVREETPDARADLYSMGVLLYNVLTHTNPFRARTPADTMQRHLHLVPPPPSQAHPALHEHAYLDTITMHLLAKDRADRYDSAEAVIRELSRIGSTPYDIETDETLGAYVPSESVFVGRESARAVLRNQVSPYEDSLPMAWIQGGRGVGKTRLLQEAKAMAQLADYTTLLLSLDDPDGITAALPMLQHLAGSTVTDDDSTCVTVDSSIDSSTAESNAPRYWIGIDDLPLVLQDARTVALAPLLRNLVAQMALRHQLREWHPVVLVCTGAGEARAQDVLRAALDVPTPIVAIIPVRNFTETELAAYLSVLTGLADPPPLLLTQIAEYTGGHPLCVAETVRALIHRGLLFDRAGRWRSTTFEDIGVNLAQLDVPGTIESMVAQSYAALTTAQQELVGALATADRPLSRAWLAHLLQRPISVEEMSATALRPLVHYDPPSATFRLHTRAQRQSLYHQLGATRRATWHDAVADLLAADPQADLAEICYHRSHGSDHEQAQGARQALADHLYEQGRSAEAIPYLTAYLREAATEDPVRWAIRYHLGKAYQRTRQFDAAIETFRDGIAELGRFTGLREWHLRYREAWGHVAMRQRLYKDAEHQFRQVLAMLSDDSLEVAARIRVRNAIAQAQLYQAEHPDAIAAAVTTFRQTAEEAAQLPSDLRATITNNDLGHALMQQRQYAEAITVLQRDAMYCASAEQWPAQIRALSLLTEAHRQLRQFAQANETCRQAIALAKRHHDTEQLMHLYNNLGNLYECLGQSGDPHLYDRAIGYYERALDLTLRLGDISCAIATTLNLGILHRQRGNVHRAERLLHSTVAFAEAQQLVEGLDEQAWCQAHLELGNLFHQQKQFTIAHHHVAQARHLAERRASCRHLWFWTVATEAELRRDEGQLEDAKQLIPEMQRLASTPDTRATARQIMRSLGLPG